MQLSEAKQQFINSWGSMGSHWGVNRTMAQMHALLMVHQQPLCTEDIMAALQISRGNANMNIRELMGWGLAERVVKPGERKEFFTAEKDIWKIAGIIARERKKRELEPMLKLLQQLEVDPADQSEEAMAFRQTVSSIQGFAQKVNSTLDVMSKAEESWFLSNLMKWIT